MNDVKGKSENDSSFRKPGARDWDSLTVLKIEEDESKKKVEHANETLKSMLLHNVINLRQERFNKGV